MKIAIRMDDITPDMDWQKFERFQKLCDAYQIKPLIGVVPDNQDSMLQMDTPREDFWQQMRDLQNQGWVIAQHGCTHVYTTKRKGCFPLNALSEYAGESYEQQLKKLKIGQDILKEHGIETDLFMAPAHSYDKHTVKALKALGFRALTDGFGDYPYQWKGLTFYPISFHQGASLKKEKGYTTFVVHANMMSNQDFERYEKLFQQHQDKLISYQEYMQVQARKRSVLGRLGEYVKALAKHYMVKLKSRQ